MSFIAALKDKGYDPEKLKKLFERDDLESADDTTKVKALIDRHSVLVRDGLDANYKDARFFAAIDRAYDVGQEQISTTIMRGLIGKDPSSAEVLSTIKDWKLDNLLVDVLDANGQQVLLSPGVCRKFLDLPILFNVLVPLVTAYTKVRWAKLWTNGNTIPLYKYDAASPTTETHLLCRVITGEIAKQSENMGYRAIERDVILPTLLYGYAWTFPTSDYHTEKSLWKEEGKKTEEYVVREGISWSTIHPTKVFFDRSQPMFSINSDTGVSWMGYWSVVPFRTIDNDNYWNRTRVLAGSRGGDGTWIRPDGWRLYNEFYPCTLKFPETWVTNTAVNQREDRWYTSQLGESAVQIVNVFDKIIPKDCGLYDCEIPVWHRFMYAGDGTVIGCIPFAYTPGTCNLYDSDSNRARNTSLALELVPHQDHLGNLLTQYVLSVQQNLMSCVFYNEEQISAENITLLKNLGYKRYEKTNFIPFKKRMLAQQGTTVDDTFYSPAFPKHQTAELIAAINTMLSTMERMLGFSPQEVGAAATHEQSATEVTIVDSGTSTRLALTDSFMNDGRQARQRCAYDAWFEYSTKEIDQELSGITPIHEKALKKLGFTIEKIEESRTIKIKGKRRLADIDSFVSARPPADRFNDSKVAIAMMQAIQLVMNNPLVIERYGLDFILTRFNEILEYAGVPGDWRFSLDQAKDPQPNLKQTEELIGQNNEKLAKEIQENLAKPIGESIAKLGEVQQALGQGLAKTAQDQQAIASAVGEHSAALKALLEQVAKIMAELMGRQPGSPQGPPMGPPPMQGPPLPINVGPGPVGQPQMM